MIYYRMLKKTDPTTLEPTKITHELVDLIYSNSMPTHSLFTEDRQVWSLTKTPESALAWLGKRGHGLYDRLAYYDFQKDDGQFYDLTELSTWVALISISRSKNGLVINNLNCQTSIEAVRAIIPCMRSAWSMARGCEEVVFIPAKAIDLTVAEDFAHIPRNPVNAENILTEITYDDQTIDMLLEQLDEYDIRPTLQSLLEKMKVA